jgi:pseudouridine synthase
MFSSSVAGIASKGSGRCWMSVPTISTTASHHRRRRRCCWTTIYSSFSTSTTVQSDFVSLINQGVTIRCLSSSSGRPSLLNPTPILRSNADVTNKSQTNYGKEDFGHRIVQSIESMMDGTNKSINTTSTTSTIRLSKLLSQNATNLTISRRQAEKLIHDGEVTLAGEVIRTPQALLDIQAVTSNTVLKVQGKAVQFDSALLARSLRPNNIDDDQTYDESSSSALPPPRIWAVHKVAGEVVSERDPHDRPSMMDRLRRGGVGRIKAKATKRIGSSGGGSGTSGSTGGQQQVHLKPIGRLDMPTEGLILVTNDGDFARQMELPSSQIHRIYRVRVHGQLTSYKLDRIRRGGITYEDVRYPPMKVAVENSRNSTGASGGSRAGRPRRSSTNTWLQITSTEGKNRQVRNVFAALGGACVCVFCVCLSTFLLLLLLLLLSSFYVPLICSIPLLV